MDNKKIATRIMQIIGITLGGFVLFRALAHLFLTHSGPLVIPTCTSSSARSTLDKIVENSPSVSKGTKILDIDSIEERGWDQVSQERTCHAFLYLNSGSIFVVYKIHPTSDKSNYLVEMQEVPF